MKIIFHLIILVLLFSGISCKKDNEMQNPDKDYIPNSSALADNGRLDGTDSIVWDFGWPKVEGATEYYIYVINATAKYPVLNRGEITTNYYHYVSQDSYMGYTNYNNWTWKVKAKVNNEWREWSPIVRFSVEPVNTD